jgi:hypothetical protein
MQQIYKKNRQIKKHKSQPAIKQVITRKKVALSQKTQSLQKKENSFIG